jgi:hypothetical protein
VRHPSPSCCHGRGAAAQVWDNDGQFLLIEAALALPRWLKPETAANRVWLRRGRLHVLPLPSAAAPDLPAAPSAAQALAVLRQERCAPAAHTASTTAPCPQRHTRRLQATRSLCTCAR